MELTLILWQPSLLKWAPHLEHAANVEFTFDIQNDQKI